ncbi:hypothetical protein MPSEU_000736700 [Mayamaea pseudoterrestris]|nr:hypothetical protein MPSEU_000736700 [Mayamaea pseudoterrestris]
MGCTPSKDLTNAKIVDTDKSSSPPEADEESPLSSMLSPSVAMQNLLHRHYLIDMSTAAGRSLQSAILVGGQQVKKTIQSGEKGFREASHQVPRHLRNVFAKPIELIVNGASMTIPVYPKTPREKEYLENALKHNFIFENLGRKQIFPMVQALEQHIVTAGTTIIEQGDEGDYFYILFEGECDFILDDEKVGTAHKGDSFGELALLYDAPRAATVKAATNCVLYRVDQVAFRLILREQAQAKESSKLELLKKVPFLKDVDSMELERLADVMTPRTFTAGQTLASKGDEVRAFWLLESGTVQLSNIGDGNIKYEDIAIKAGDFFGEFAIASSRPTIADAVAKEDGMAFVIDRETFEKVLGKLDRIIMRSTDRKKLSGIKIIKDTELDTTTIATLASYISDRKWRAGQRIMVEGKSMEAGLYLVRKGKVQIVNKGKAHKEILGEGCYFGDDQLMTDAKRRSNGPDDPTTCKAMYTVEVLEDCVCGILWLAVLRNCLDSKMLGQPHASLLDSLIARQIPMNELNKHTILGSGTFGQVWLVSRVKSSGERQPYALKVQSKYELVDSGQARAVVEEKNIMAGLHSPFLISLVTTYKDVNCVYMLMELVQGGELYSVMVNGGGGMHEDKAKFYIAGIAEGLLYMHRRGVVYRDLKPENVLISNAGYPVIIDFGFAKRVRNKTYTLCGTPLYLAPEVILNRGHNWSADHWSLGVLIYEMLVGHTPFYRSGMDQSELFKSIVRSKFHIPRRCSQGAAEIISGLLIKDPSMRLGSLAGGESDILNSTFLGVIDMVKLRKHTIKPPQVPIIRDPLDASNFEDWSHLDDKSKLDYPRLNEEKELIFDGF